MAQTVSISRDLVSECVSVMTNSIEKNSQILQNAGNETQTCIVKALKQAPGVQTWKMASLVLQNALLFYDQIAGRRGIKPIQQLKYMNHLHSDWVIKAWEHVLTIDYAPIFEVSVDMLHGMTDDVSSRILDNIYEATSKIVALKMSRSGDMYGMLFQKLISDRKQLATFYTLPESAALLATIVTPSEHDPVWRQTKKVKDCRVADFACGTGMLLSSVYKRMIANYGINGGDMWDIHPHMMEKNLIGYDVLPIATHITVSALAGIYPNRDFKNTGIKALNIGPNIKGGGHRLGSLELIKQASTFTPTGTRMTAKGGKQTGEASIMDDTCDIIVMNPPFTRNTRHGGDGDSGMTVPAFAAFGIPEAAQLEMSDRAQELFSDTCAHGHAGLGSYFVAIADKKLKEGGMFGIVVPSTITASPSWEKTRKLLSEKYKDAILLSLEAKKTGDTAFSADTSMSEVIFIAKKRMYKEISKQIESRIRVVSLKKRPTSIMSAMTIGEIINHHSKIRMLEDGVDGGTELSMGNIKIGTMLDCPFGSEWNFNNVADMSLLQFTYQLTHGTLHVPKEMPNDIPIVPINKIANIGPDSQMFIGKMQKGPFVKSTNTDNPQYPVLWGNDSDSQHSMIVEYDSSLIPKQGAPHDKINKLWKTAARAHINNFLSFASQRLVVAYTEQKTLGGTSMPSIILDDLKHEKAFTVWSNSTLGILCFWYMASRQQRGRSIIRRKGTLEIPTLDLSALTRDQIASFDVIFSQYSNEDLLPVNQMYRDPVRIALDNEVLKILGIESDLNDIRRRFCSEPHISLGKDLAN